MDAAAKLARVQKMQAAKKEKQDRLNARVAAMQAGREKKRAAQREEEAAEAASSGGGGGGGGKRQKGEGGK